MFDIQEELKKLPGKPGVYIMHDEKDAIIYVGKAVSLKNRVRQYFQASRNKGAKIDQMVTRIRRFEYIVTDSELEALVLECNLIKEHRPKYNTMLKDDKTYPFIKVTVNEDYPRILFSQIDEKGQEPVFRTLHQCRGREGHDRTSSKSLQDPLLPAESAAGYRKRETLSELSYPSVQGSLSGIYFKRRIPEKCQRGHGFSERQL